MTEAITRRFLGLEELPPASVTRLWLDLLDDGLGRPICIPVLIAKVSADGPTAGITAAVHGNELNGVPVIHGLFAKMDLEKLRGTVVAVPVVNVPAFLRHHRLLDEGFDLNHVFPGDERGNFAQVYAHRIVERVLRHVDFLVDLHTASTGRVNCLYVRADMKNEFAARMAYLQRPQIIVHSPPSDGTLRGAADALGIPAITVEVGSPSRFQGEYVRRAGVGLRAVLTEWEMLPQRQIALGEPPILCRKSAWLYTDEGGLLKVLPKVTDPVHKGEPVARIVDAFGDPVREYTSPSDGVVIGHSVDPVASAGARILHIGILADARSHLVERA